MVGSGCPHLVGEVKAGLGAADCHDNGQVSVLTGDVQRRVAMAILLVQVTVVSEEATDHFNLTPPYGQVEGCVAILKRHTTQILCDICVFSEDTREGETGSECRKRGSQSHSNQGCCDHMVSVINL